MNPVILLALVATLSQQGDNGVEVWLDDLHAVSYRARVEGDWLIVAATHEPGWHTYAMDNLRRAREKTGEADPETELPTVIVAGDGRQIEGDWRQSEPKDLSTPEIRWYTWGFEGRSYFAVRVEEPKLPASVHIDAQACTESLCAWVDGLEVPVEVAEPGGESWVDPESLVVVSSDGSR